MRSSVAKLFTLQLQSTRPAAMLIHLSSINTPVGKNYVMRRFIAAFVVSACLGMTFTTAAPAADVYTYDGVHSSVSFKARHLDISWIHVRFNEASGKFVIDRQDPSKSTFEFSVKADSVDTGNVKRDEHLRQPDYFDTKQFPTIDFKSTSVKAIEGGYEVTGDFTMHGKTKSITMVLKGGKEVEWKGVKRVGFSTEIALKRSDYGFDPAAIGLIGDEALILIDCEGMRQ